MKTRYSLVSNSSSSNFIVWYKDTLFKEKEGTLLTKDQVKLLKKNHFKLSTCGHPSGLSSSDFISSRDNRKSQYSLSYALSISCNQDDVICFLVSNKIPFIASIHYGHETCIYQKNSKYIYFFTNFGDEVETYHQDANLDKLIDGWNKQKAVPSRKVLVKLYIEEQKKISEELTEWWANGTALKKK